VAGDWRKLHTEELHNLYALPNTVRLIESRTIRWEGHTACILVKEPEGRSPLGRPLHMWEDNIRMKLRQTVWNGADWMHLAHDRDQCCEHCNEHSGSIKRC
jgi:hypothetical protein